MKRHLAPFVAIILALGIVPACSTSDDNNTGNGGDTAGDADGDGSGDAGGDTAPPRQGTLAEVSTACLAACERFNLCDNVDPFECDTACESVLADVGSFGEGCGGSYLSYYECTAENLCDASIEAGCPDQLVAAYDTTCDCCNPGDHCGYANDFLCECEDQPWDRNDCEQIGCCVEGDPCEWADDGECDCDGEYPWDTADCG